MDGLKTSSIIHEKTSSRNIFKVTITPTPRSYVLKDAMSYISKSNRLIVKPIDCFSGIGISIADSIDSLIDLLKRHLLLLKLEIMLLKIILTVD